MKRYLIAFISTIAFRNNVRFLPVTATYLSIYRSLPTIVQQL